MQATQTYLNASTKATGRSWSAEILAYVLLFLLALVVRLAELDAVPMTDREAIDALAAWVVVYPQTSAQPQPASNPMGFWGQLLGFSLLGGTEFAARLFGLIGGLVLILMPLLFRPWIGPSRAFLLCLLLAASPIGIIASRSAEPMVWTMVLALGALWAAWRYVEAPTTRRGLWVGAWVVSLILLGEGGLWVALILAGATSLALWWTAFNAPYELDTPGDALLARARGLLNSFPLPQALLLGLSLVFLVGTGFMLHPMGLGVVGNNLGAALAALWTPAHPNMSPLMSLGTLFVYELPLLIFVLAGTFALHHLERLRFSERLAMMAFFLGALALLIIQGATPAWALWLSLPLAWIASAIAQELMVDRPISIFWFNGLSDENELFSYRYAWVKWFLGLLALALFATLLLHLQEVGRGFLALPTGQSLGDTISMMFSETLGQLRYSLVWTFVTIIFFVVGFFLVASVWGNDQTLQGLGLGALAFILLSGLGTGWNASVEKAAHPAEYWRMAEGSVSAGAPLLRRTLFDVAQRQTRGFPNLQIAIVQDETQGLRADGLMGWLVRDFANARWVNSIEAARSAPVVIAPYTDNNNDLQLGGNYVGQSFALRQHLGASRLEALDGLGWLLLRRLRPASAETLVTDRAVLWLNMDVYNNVPR
ncbi:MAG: glycosyltransferase family 39 protein [Anaerolineae bacterium]|nr:glycosyltransferase family 39 protein [Anaerolineae bacterium]MDW8171496.1 glycosyltransferase family 39 protein [Anaerolineae bacterium]